MSKWNDRVSAIVMGWYPGQEGGLAIARMLAGEFSPSGKLPMSIEERPEDNPTYGSYYPIKPQTKRGATNDNVTYTEGVFVGYRGYDRSGTAPLYPFGHGLTYTDFRYDGLRVVPSGDGFDVIFTVENTGKYDAEDVPQVYVGAVCPSVPRPYKELKGFVKTAVGKGEKKEVTIHLDRDAFEYYDVEKHGFSLEKGRFRILVGASAGDIRLEEEIVL